jgi:hypothetical protein
MSGCSAVLYMCCCLNCPVETGYQSTIAVKSCDMWVYCTVLYCTVLYCTVLYGCLDSSALLLPVCKWVFTSNLLVATTVTAVARPVRATRLLLLLLVRVAGMWASLLDEIRIAICNT